MVVLKDIRIFGIQYVLYYFIFYSLGYYINKYQLFTKQKALIALLVLVWFILGSFWRPRELPSFVSLTGGIATMVRFTYKFMVAFFAVFAMFSLAPMVLNGLGWFNRMMCKLGAISLGIYTCHLIFTNMLVLFIQQYIDNNVAVVLIAFLLLSVTSYCVVTILGKYKLTSRLLLGKV